MLIIGLCMVFASTLVELFADIVPVWLVSIANILFFTGQMLCFISWYFITKKIIIKERDRKVVQALLLNGYSSKSHAKFNEYQRETTVDYFLVEIYDNSTDKGDEQE